MNNYGYNVAFTYTFCDDSIQINKCEIVDDEVMKCKNILDVLNNFDTIKKDEKSTLSAYNKQVTSVKRTIDFSKTFSSEDINFLAESLKNNGFAKIDKDFKNDDGINCNFMIEIIDYDFFYNQPISIERILYLKNNRFDNLPICFDEPIDREILGYADVDSTSVINNVSADMNKADVIEVIETYRENKKEKEQQEKRLAELMPEIWHEFIIMFDEVEDEELNINNIAVVFVDDPMRLNDFDFSFGVSRVCGFLNFDIDVLELGKSWANEYGHFENKSQTLIVDDYIFKIGRSKKENNQVKRTFFAFKKEYMQYVNNIKMIGVDDPSCIDTGNPLDDEIMCDYCNKTFTVSRDFHGDVACKHCSELNYI